MRNLSKSLLVFLLCLLVTVTFWGCRKVEEKKAGKKGNVKQEITIAYAGWGKNNSDVALQEKYPDLLVRYMIFDRLVDFKDGKLSPQLAESWDISDGGRVIALHLRKGVKFHNGEPFTAEAVKFTLDRAIAQGFGSWIPLISRLEKKEGTVEIKDSHTVVLKFNEPSYENLVDLAEYQLSIISPSCVEPKGDLESEGLKKAIGTGLWKVVEYVPGDKLVLEVNEEYWGEKPKHLKKVTIKAIPDANARVMSLKSGDVDCILDNIHGGTNYVPRSLLTELKEKGFNVVSTVLPETRLIAFNYKREPFNNPLVRKAFNKAIDTEAIVSVVLKGWVKPALEGVWPPRITPYLSKFPNKGLLSYNLNEAKNLLAEAGWKLNENGLLEKGGKQMEIRALVQGDDLDGKQIMEIIQAQLKKLGISVKIETLEKAAFKEARKNGDFDLILFYAGGPSSRIFMRTSWQFTSLSGVPPIYADEKTNALCSTFLNTMDDSERTEAFNELNEYLCEVAAVILLYYDIVAVASQPNIEGIAFDGSNPDFSQVVVK